jgi:hypothetical protein
MLSCALLPSSSSFLVGVIDAVLVVDLTVCVPAVSAGFLSPPQAASRTKPAIVPTEAKLKPPRISMGEDRAEPSSSRV